MKIAQYLIVLDDKILEQELMRCMTEEENRDVRRSSLAIINLNQTTFPEFIKRTRDIETDIRITVFKKLY